MALALMVLVPDSRETGERVPARHVQQCPEEQLCRTKVLRHPHGYSLFCLGTGPSSPITLAECPPKLEFSCQSSAISGYSRGRAPGNTHAPQDFQEEGQLSASVPRGPRLWRWTVLLFARGRTNCCPALHSRKFCHPSVYLCQLSELKNFRAGRFCLFPQLAPLFLSEQIA